jgi:hypothetical protein
VFVRVTAVPKTFLLQIIVSASPPTRRCLVPSTFPTHRFPTQDVHFARALCALRKGMPLSLTQIQIDGMFSDSTPLFQGDVLIDGAMSIRFSDPLDSIKPVYVRRLFLTFFQPNYTLSKR